jgi:sugar/nucleoside kinase (ribokinase family)
MSVVVLGDCNVDLEMMLPDSERLELRNSDPFMSGGGSAANTAAALARLGAEVAFAGVVGNDAFGTAAIDSLKEAGVGVDRIRRSVEQPTVVVMVVVPADGERLIYVWPPRGGAHDELTANDALSAVAGSRWVHVSGIALRGEPAASAIVDAMAAARQSGVTVSLDLNLRLENWGWTDEFRTTIDRACEVSDVVFGGAVDEIGPLAESADPRAAIAGLARPDRIVVGRFGPEGAVAHDGAGFVESPGFTVPIVDTVGAGDAFDAGFIAARLAGDDLGSALRFANAVAALSIGRSGARSTPTLGEVAALMESN